MLVAVAVVSLDVAGFSSASLSSAAAAPPSVSSATSELETRELTVAIAFVAMVTASGVGVLCEGVMVVEGEEVLLAIPIEERMAWAGVTLV